MWPPSSWPPGMRLSEVMKRPIQPATRTGWGVIWSKEGIAGSQWSEQGVDEADGEGLAAETDDGVRARWGALDC